MSYITGYQGLFNPGQAVVISNGQTDSAAIATGGMALTGIIIPAAFTGASISFLVSTSLGGTYVPLYDSTNTLISITVGTSRAYSIDPKQFAGVGFLKIRSASTETADRTIICTLKGF